MNEHFTFDGAQFAVTIEQDCDCGNPWEEEDGHGPVSDWTRRSKLPGELVLGQDGAYKRFYDFAEACRIARRDGWDCAPYGQGSKRNRASRAAMSDLNRLRRFYEGDWCYVGLTVRLLDNDGDDLGIYSSLYGIESDAGDYLDEVARELAEELLISVRIAA